MTNTNNTRQKESGNVLFLILIAVALFAALSYVVTQSTRSGGGSTEREKNILSSASMTQYPTSLRTALIRMVLGGIAVENIRFDSPTNTVPYGNSVSRQVFHPSGGGAMFQSGLASLSVSGQSELPWSFNANFEVPEIGIAGVGGNEVIAFLPNVSVGVCRQVNKELNIGGSCTDANLPIAPAGVTLANVSAQMDVNSSYTFPVTDQTDLVASAPCATAFTRQASGCFRLSTNEYVFYSVLLER